MENIETIESNIQKSWNFIGWFMLGIFTLHTPAGLPPIVDVVLFLLWFNIALYAIVDFLFEYYGD